MKSLVHCILLKAQAKFRLVKALFFFASAFYLPVPATVSVLVPTVADCGEMLGWPWGAGRGVSQPEGGTLKGDN